jgi:hypothetical protein
VPVTLTGYLDRPGFGVRVAFCAVARVTGSPGSVMLTLHQEIAVTYQPGSGFRTAVPVGYAFPAGT